MSETPNKPRPPKSQQQRARNNGSELSSCRSAAFILPPRGSLKTSATGIAFIRPASNAASRSSTSTAQLSSTTASGWSRLVSKDSTIAARSTSGRARAACKICSASVSTTSPSYTSDERAVDAIESDLGFERLGRARGAVEVGEPVGSSGQGQGEATDLDAVADRTSARLDGACQPAVRPKRTGGDASQHAARSTVRIGAVAGRGSGQARSRVIAPAHRPTTKTTEQRLPTPLQFTVACYPFRRRRSDRSIAAGAGQRAKPKLIVYHLSVIGVWCEIAETSLSAHAQARRDVVVPSRFSVDQGRGSPIPGG